MPFSHMEIFTVANCLLLWMKKLFQNEAYSLKKESEISRTNLFLQGLTPVQKGGKIENGRVAYPLH